MKSTLLLALVLGLSTSLATAQEIVTFFVQPKESFVRVDGRVLDLTQERTIQLAPGTYQVELWSPKFNTREVSITVKDGEPLRVVEGLRTVSPTYDAYRERLSEYNVLRLKRTLGEGSVAVFSGLLIAAAVVGRKDKLDEVRDYTLRQKALYDDGVFNGAERFRTNYNNGVAEFEDVQQQHNAIVVTSTVLATAGIAFLVKRFTSKKRKKYVRPQYNASNPFIDETSLLYRPNVNFGGVTSPFGLTLQF